MSVVLLGLALGVGSNALMRDHILGGRSCHRRCSQTDEISQHWSKVCLCFRLFATPFLHFFVLSFFPRTYSENSLAQTNPGSLQNLICMEVCVYMCTCMYVCMYVRMHI